MSASIEQAAMQIKHDVSKAFDAAAIVALCRSIGYSWRTRQFGPVATIQGFLLQVLHGNTACSHVPRLLGKDVTAEAYGMARSRLPLELFQRLLEQVCSRLRECVDTAAGWHGHRVWMPRKGPRKGASHQIWAHYGDDGVGEQQLFRNNVSAQRQRQLVHPDTFRGQYLVFNRPPASW